jgi:hypothetical protein
VPVKIAHVSETNQAQGELRDPGARSVLTIHNDLSSSRSGNLVRAREQRIEWNVDSAGYVGVVVLAPRRPSIES